MIFTTQEQLDERLAYWQKVLRLQDWDIRAKICCLNEIGTASLGDVTVTWEKKEAFIRLLHPDGYARPDACHNEQDHERTLVHELLHVSMAGMDAHLDDLPTKKEYDNAEEQHVHFLSLALVELNRRDGRPLNPSTHSPTNGIYQEYLLNGDWSANGVHPSLTEKDVIDSIDGARNGR